VRRQFFSLTYVDGKVMMMMISKYAEEEGCRSVPTDEVMMMMNITIVTMH